MRVGIALGTEYTAKASMLDRLNALVEQVALAREYGFDCVHVGQHYLSWPLQTLQPIPLLGRLAAEAGDMYMGTGILLLPLHHPVEVAEQIATLDNICKGRFIFGVGLGYVDEEFRAFGLEKSDRVGRFEESLELIKRLWTEDEVTFHGKHFSVTGLVPTLRPIQQPYPPIWMAANNHPAVRRAARLGAVWYGNPHANIETLKEQMAIYKSACADKGMPVPEHIALSRETYVAETRDAAFAECRPFLEKRYQAYVGHGQDKALPEGDRFDKPFEGLSRDRFIIGDPDDCVREIKRYEALGFNYIMLELQWFDMYDDLAMKSLQLLGQEVLPKVR